MSLRYQQGVNSEAIAAAHLISCGHTILKTRYKTQFGEADIVSEDVARGFIIFTEVKHRGNEHSYNCISPWQMRKYCRIAPHFIQEHYDLYKAHCIRFDYIEVYKNTVENHIQNAWMCD